MAASCLSGLCRAWPSVTQRYPQSIQGARQSPGSRVTYLVTYIVTVAQGSVFREKLIIGGGLQRELFLEAGALGPMLAQLHSGRQRLRELAAHTLAALTEGTLPGGAAQQLAAAPATVQDLGAMLHCGSSASRYWAATCLTRLAGAPPQPQGEPRADAPVISEVGGESRIARAAPCACPVSGARQGPASRGPSQLIRAVARHHAC